MIFDIYEKKNYEVFIKSDYIFVMSVDFVVYKFINEWLSELILDILVLFEEVVDISLEKCS